MYHKIARLVGVLTVGLLLQSCSQSTPYFMVTNTKSGHVCIQDMELSAGDPKAQTVAKIMYSYYGAIEGQNLGLYSGNTSEGCNGITQLDAPVPVPNIIISEDFYITYVEQPYLGITPVRPGTDN